MQDRHNTKFHSKAVANKLGLDAKLTYKILKQCVKKTEAIIRKGDDVITDNVTFCHDIQLFVTVFFSNITKSNSFIVVYMNEFVVVANLI